MPRMKPGRVTRSSMLSRIVTIDAAHRVRARRRARNGRRRAAGDRIRRPVLTTSAWASPIRQLAQRLEPLEHIAAAQPAVGRNHRGVTLQAGARLRPLGDALGLLLILQHVGVAAAVAIVDGERVAGEHPGEPRERRRLLCRQRLRPAESRLRRLRGALVVVVFARPVHAPRRRVGGLFADLDQPDVWIPRLLLALEDRRQQAGDEKHQQTPTRSRSRSTSRSGVVPWRIAARHECLSIKAWRRGRRRDGNGRTSPHPRASCCPSRCRARSRRDSAGSSPEGPRVPRRDHDRLVEVHEREALECR